MDATQTAEITRFGIGVVALYCAGSQLAYRLVLARTTDSHTASTRREVTTGLAALLLLLGVGIGNLTHLQTPLSFSTILISAGVLAAAVAQVYLYRAAKQRTIESGEANGIDQG